MNFDSNDYALSKEYQNRMQHQAQRSRRGGDIASTAPQPHHLPRLTRLQLRTAVIVLVVVMMLFGGFVGVQAQSGSPQLDPGRETQTAADLFNLGVKYIGEGKFEQAIAELSDVIEIDPEFGAAYAARGVSYHSLGYYTEAIADYSVAIEIFPGYYSAYNFRGMAHLAQGNYQQAIVDGRRAATLNSNYANAHWTLGNAYMVAEDYAAAKVSLERYIALAGANANPQAAELAAQCQDQLNA